MQEADHKLKHVNDRSYQELVLRNDNSERLIFNCVGALMSCIFECIRVVDINLQSSQIRAFYILIMCYIEYSYI